MSCLLSFSIEWTAVVDVLSSWWNFDCTKHPLLRPHTHSFLKKEPTLSTSADHPTSSTNLHQHPPHHIATILAAKHAPSTFPPNHSQARTPTCPIPAPLLLTVHPPIWCTNSNVCNVMHFSLNKQIRCSQNVWMGTGSLVRSWTLTYRYPSTPNPISSLSRNAGPSISYTNFLMPLLTMSAANLKWHINWYFILYSLLVLTLLIPSCLLPFQFQKMGPAALRRHRTHLPLLTSYQTIFPRTHFFDIHLPIHLSVQWYHIEVCVTILWN